MVFRMLRHAANRSQKVDGVGQGKLLADEPGHKTSTTNLTTSFHSP